eukprot:TRINITY_DN10117_c0_g1_i1.p1 TRINITY_DN10117_c0_g1~~TRINITY_DN10117_c0_g1_i1.p1  ORF type:complete len:132 (-),score=14.17 TRINITY_DN10117_c0_g1_i1:180-575(-)
MVLCWLRYLKDEFHTNNQGGSVISTGCNDNRTFLQGKVIPSLHAEISALRGLNKKTKGTVMYIVRVSKTGLAASKPCEICLATLKAYGVEKVYFSTREGIEVQKISQIDPYVRCYGSWHFDERPVIFPHQE